MPLICRDHRINLSQVTQATVLGNLCTNISSKNGTVMVNIPWNNVGSKKSIPLLLDNFPNESPQFNVRAYLVSCLASACFNQLPSHLRLGCQDLRATSHCHAIHLPDPQHAPSGRLPVRWPATRPGKLTVCELENGHRNCEFSH